MYEHRAALSVRSLDDGRGTVGYLGDSIRAVAANGDSLKLHPGLIVGLPGFLRWSREPDQCRARLVLLRGGVQRGCRAGLPSIRACQRVSVLKGISITIRFLPS
jgi:hypothetical protein